MSSLMRACDAVATKVVEDINRSCKEWIELGIIKIAEPTQYVNVGFDWANIELEIDVSAYWEWCDINR